METIYSDTYWVRNGRYQKIADHLATLIPEDGPCSDDTPALEAYRKAANLYYDLYNNGGCNHGNVEFRRGLNSCKIAFNDPEPGIARAAIVAAELHMDTLLMRAHAEHWGLTGLMVW